MAKESEYYNWIFVFGSNLAGIHGGGAAKYAFEHYRAKWGKGEGLQGNSYALPTKDENVNSLGLDAIKKYVIRFLQHAGKQKHTAYKVTAIGCGLAGYKPEEIGPMFELAPDNCLMPPEWKNVKELQGKKFWRYP